MSLLTHIIRRAGLRRRTWMYNCENYKAKIVTAAEAVAQIKNGSRVFIGSGCGEPQRLIHAMVKNQTIQDVMIFQMLAFTLGRYLKDNDFPASVCRQAVFRDRAHAPGGL